MALIFSFIADNRAISGILFRINAVGWYQGKANNLHWFARTPDEVVEMIQTSKLTSYSFFFYLVLLMGCATNFCRDVRLYNTLSGNILHGQILDARQTHGQIMLTNQKTGEQFNGDYTSIPNDSSGMVMQSHQWANAYGFSFNKPRAIYGEGILVGSSGTVIEIVYTVDRRSLHGHGVGRDNKGNQYKLHF